MNKNKETKKNKIIKVNKRIKTYLKIKKIKITRKKIGYLCEKDYLCNRIK